LDAAAADLSTLLQRLEQTHAGVPRLSALVGHSFGGKVALRASMLLDFTELNQVFSLDSNPGAQAADEDNEVLRVIRAVRAVRPPIATRAAAVEAVREQGLSAGLARWMSTNLRRSADGSYHWVFDLDAIERLLTDYFQHDYWDYLAATRSKPEYHLLIAEHSDRVDHELGRRAAALPPESQCHTHFIPDAGHWLHVDNPAAVLDVLERHLH
jgi:pimeloyl-ACP methyl ester carboxylesterase